MTGRYLEDFALGQIFRSGPVPIDGERIKQRSTTSTTNGCCATFATHAWSFIRLLF